MGLPSARAAADSPTGPGWVNWRGPEQNGVSRETHLPDTWKPGGTHDLWSYTLSGRGTAVIHGDRVYAWGYRGAREDLVEVLVCLDSRTGHQLWERRFNDFLSDVIYNRYSIGAPAVDAVTGDVYLMTSAGLAMCLDRDGQRRWEHSMMEEFGRLTFPNGRTGAPVIDNDLVIFRGITSNWGRQGPARDRFYAFDKRNGKLVWSSTPGVGPPFLKDSSFSTPVFETRRGRRIFYAGTGCGNVVAVNARTGEPLWRYPMAMGGVNSSPVIDKDTLIAIHGKQNIDDTGHGRLVAIDLNKALDAALAADKPVVLDRSSELWRNDAVSMFTSSPVVVNGRVYQVSAKGELFAVDVRTGRTIWTQKLGEDQLHASPLWADGKLYVPMWHDGLYILKDAGDRVEQLCHVAADQLGLCIGSPSVWNGRMYLLTTKKLYCFGRSGGVLSAIGGMGADLLEAGRTVVATAGDAYQTVRPTGPVQALQAVPSEVLLRAGESMKLEVREVDGQGRLVRRRGGEHYRWSHWVAPTAKVKATLQAEVKGDEMIAAKQAKYSAGAFRVESRDGKTSGTLRGRILPVPPFREDFQSFALSQKAPADGTAFAYPPLAWNGARLKWQVRRVDGSQVLAKTLDRILFQRSMVFLGHPDQRNYTVMADMMTDGNRRQMSVAGLVNQRYLVVLDGNWQQIEVSSNYERLKVARPFAIKAGTWYRLKCRVDVAADGSGVVRARAWRRDGVEPEGWTIEVPVDRAHRHGSPGLYGFSPQSRFRVYLDNVAVTPNH